MKVSVYASSVNVQDKELKEQLVVVIDVLRATSTIITALHNGCREVIPTIEIEEAVNISKNYEKDSFLLCGERNIIAIEGFHLSNSPSEYTRETVEGKTLLLTTTNGSKAIRRAGEGKETIIGSLINVDAVSDYINGKNMDVVFICAGTDGKFSIDDITAAGAIISRIKSTDLQLSDLAFVCCDLYESYKDNLSDLLKRSAHYKLLEDAAMNDDIEYCLKLNAAPVVGVYKDGVIKSFNMND